MYNENYLSSVKRDLEKEKMRREILQQELIQAEEEIICINIDIENGEKARIVLQNVAKAVQQNLEERINKIVQMALAIVFEDSTIPVFKLEMVQRRGKTEVDITIDSLSPLDSDAGGVVDIVVFALKMSLWSMKPNRRLILSDEPFRNLSKNFQPRATEMVKVLSEKLNLQVIMITHHTIGDQQCDRIFDVEKENIISKINIKK